MLMMTNMSHAASRNLKTKTSSDLGISLSSYNYEEPGYMSSEGAKVGLDLHVTDVTQDNNFIRFDLRYAFGSVDYSSPISGTANGEPDWYVETRMLFGTDKSTKNSVFSPYAGLGYRYLFNDARGVTSSGASGYRRESNYVYLPVGVIHRTALQDQSKLLSTLEFDLLLTGKQVSRLSDTGLLQDATNTQSSGYGLKLSVIYENENGAIGPYVNYWNIAQSNTVALYYPNGTLYGTGFEPKNNTIEFGLMANQQF